MKTFKRIMIIILLLIITFGIGYFIFGWNTITNGNVPLESFKDTFYVSLDEESFISFGSMKRILIKYHEEYHYFNDYLYSDSIFTFNNTETENTITYYVSVIDNETLYCSNLNQYFYYYEV